MTGRATIRTSLLVAGLALTCQAGTVFENGGFEEDSFNHWTQNGGKWGGGIGNYNFTGDQGKSTIVDVGNDPLLASLGKSIPMVAFGNHAARINNKDNGYHFSTVTQEVTDWSYPDIYFAWSAVLQFPNNGVKHVVDEQPHFYFTVTDKTDNKVLYSVLFAESNLPESLMKSAGTGDNIWHYTDYVIAHMTIPEHHDVVITLLASDCALGGHGGYVYLDAFSPTNPDTSGNMPVYDAKDFAVPEPGTWLSALVGALGLAGLARRRRSGR